MPYIKTEQRSKLEPSIRTIVRIIRDNPPANIAGLLNYVITKIVVSIWDTWPRYTVGNALVGALECAKAEFYRRHLAPYEDLKIKENGDVHPL